jgi:hypothetical protein
VPPGSEMVFRYGGKTHRKRSKPERTRSRSLRRRGLCVPTALWRPKARESRGPSPPKLPPGEYVLEVFVKVQQGDSSYYFRIMVE